MPHLRDRFIPANRSPSRRSPQDRQLSGDGHSFGLSDSTPPQALHRL